MVVVTPASVLTNGGFEVPASGTNWAGTGWSAASNIWRVQRGGWSGARGAYAAADTADAAWLMQTVSVSTGTYTFSAWTMVESGTVLTNLEIQIEWLDAVSNLLDRATVDWTHLPADGLWRRITATAACDSNELDLARVTVSAGWDAKTADPAGVRLDAAQLVVGSATGSPFTVNSSFEYGGTNDNVWWHGSQWGVVPEHDANSHRPWNHYAGDRAAVLEGWVAGSHTSRFVQHVYPASTGSWTFSVWMAREADFNLSNAALRLEWRDVTLTNELQAAVVTNLTVPADNTWREYELQAECSDPNLHEIRVVADFAYGKNLNDNSMYIDGARLVPGGFTNKVKARWGYYNHYNYDPQLERVPGSNNFGAFLQVNYAKTTTTFYVLSDHPDIGRYPDSEGEVGMYVSYLPPHLPDTSQNWETVYADMSRAGTAVLSDTKPFHGWPASGGATVDVWRYDWVQPLSNGVPYDRSITVYYAPIFRSKYGDLVEDEKYLVRLDGFWTNGYPEAPQIFHTNQWQKDYTYQHCPHEPVDSFTNGSFESNPAETNWHGIGWQAYGATRRDDWSSHQGSMGAYLPGWYTNSPEWRTFTESAVAQPVNTTGGMYTFSTWLRSDPGVHPNLLEARLEWYGTNGTMLQADRRKVTDYFPRDGSWHHVHVTGTCLSNDIDYVLAKVVGQFWARTGLPDRVQVDGAQLYEGSYTGVLTIANRGFEDGNPSEFRGSQWYAQPEYVSTYRSDWGARHGTMAAQYDAKSTNAVSFSETIAQCVTPATGTYTFAIWLNRGTNFPMTNAEIRMGWYDETFTNRVKADDVLPIAPPADNWWREYYVTGTCTSESLYEVRLSVNVGYEQQTNAGAECLIDVARFFEGAYEPGVARAWDYHNDGITDAKTERVPGTNVGSFLQVDYARTSTTYYVLLNTDLGQFPGQTSMVYLRTSYFHPLSNEWVDASEAMDYEGTVEWPAGSAFHGLPISGTATAALYRYRATHPLRDGDIPITNAIWMYYAPWVELYEDGADVDSIWLVQNGNTSNAYSEPQRFDSGYYNRDYGYNQEWTWDQDGDGIADSWEIIYFRDITNCLPGEDDDGDGSPNSDEYVADSIPTNVNHYFNRWITAVSGKVTHVRVDAPTTNSRLYDVYWKTNLMDNTPWIPCGHDVPGHAEGTNLWLEVTNGSERVFYRTGVKVVNPW
jgi:hypothetical protein